MGFSFQRDILGGPGTTGGDSGSKLGEFRDFRNELITGPGGFDAQIAALRDDPLLARAQRGIFDRAPAILDQLQGDLIGGALGSTQGGQVAALEAARAAAGGRGGLAFGGGASRIASAGARAVAPQQAAALGSALTQVGGMRLQLLQAQSDFAFNRRASENQLRQLFLSGAFSLTGNAQASLQAAQTAASNAAGSFSTTIAGGLLGGLRAGSGQALSFGR